MTSSVRSSCEALEEKKSVQTLPILQTIKSLRKNGIRSGARTRFRRTQRNTVVVDDDDGIEVEACGHTCDHDVIDRIAVVDDECRRGDRSSQGGIINFTTSSNDLCLCSCGSL